MNFWERESGSETPWVRETRLQICATFEDVGEIDAPIDFLVENVEAFNESAVYGVKLAVHEICTNIVEHAYNFSENARIDIWMGLAVQPSVRIVVLLRDRGIAFSNDPGDHNEPSTELDYHGDGGYGLFLAHALMDSVEYRRVNGQNVWHLSKEPVIS